MKMLIVLLMIASHSYAQQSNSETNVRTSSNLNDFQIDGESSSEKINQAKQGIFNNIKYVPISSGGETSGGSSYLKYVGYVYPQCCNCSQCYSECPVSSVGLPTFDWTEHCSGGGGGGKP
jgi:hypothetical protein